MHRSALAAHSPNRGSDTVRIALAVWNGRISPVFDVSRHLRLLDVDGGRIVSVSEATLEDADVVSRALAVARLGVNELVCGAVSRPLAEALTGHGVRVIAQVAGTEEQATTACLEGRLPDPLLSMPGCGRRVRRRRGWGRGTGGRRQGAGGGR
jgi:predicted Fe-Mo cluster-binding NifX family protein